jgi:hypothetical protein
VSSRALSLFLLVSILALSAHAYGQNQIPSSDDNALKISIPEIGGTNTYNPELSWHPAPTGELAEIYDYTFRSNISNGPGSGDPTPASSLGRTLRSQNQSHVLGLRYTLNPKWGLRVVGSAVDNHYTIQKKDGDEEDVFVEGMGDMKAQAVYSIYRDPYHRLEASIGTTIPVGATDLIGPNGKPLSSRNQLGSGTFDFIPELTYVFTDKGWELGNKLAAVIHNGKNSSGYTNGDEFGDSMSANYLILPFLTPSFTVNVKNRQRKSTDHPDTFSKARLSKTDSGPVLPGPVSPTDGYGSPGWSCDGTAALRSQLPLGRSSPIRASIEVGIPIFNLGRTETGMKTEWFAGSSITSTF